MRTASNFVIDSFHVVCTCPLQCVAAIGVVICLFFSPFLRRTKLTLFFQMHTYLNYKEPLTTAVFFIENQHKTFFVKDLDSCTS